MNKQIEIRRESLGISKTEISRACGINLGQFSGWIHGYNSISNDRIKAVVKYLGGEIVPSKIIWKGVKP